jgi:hypothetical protein
MPLKPLALAVTAASTRELFQAPVAPPRHQAFLTRATPAALGPVVDTPATENGYAVWPELTYTPGDVGETPQEGWSLAWLGGAVAAAALAGSAVNRKPSQKQRLSVADELISAMGEHELNAALAADSKVSMLAMMGKPQTEGAEFDGEAYAKTLPGIRENLDFWDPMGFCSKAGVTEGKIKFYREVELKHGRVGMLAALGLVVGENYHPLFGGDIDVPAYLAFQQTPLQTFWPAVVLAIGVSEIYSVMSFNPVPGGEMWSISSEHESGNLGFDPLEVKPTDPEELKQMQTDELTNGRIAMIAAAGMIAQELATGGKVF